MSRGLWTYFNVRCFISLTCGTTWHAAGLLGKLRSSAAETKLSNYSVELYSTLEEETGVGTGKRYDNILG